MYAMSTFDSYSEFRNYHKSLHNSNSNNDIETYCNSGQYKSEQNYTNLQNDRNKKCWQINQ